VKKINYQNRSKFVRPSVMIKGDRPEGIFGVFVVSKTTHTIDWPQWLESAARIWMSISGFQGDKNNYPFPFKFFNIRYISKNR